MFEYIGMAYVGAVALLFVLAIGYALRGLWYEPEPELLDKAVDELERYANTGDRDYFDAAEALLASASFELAWDLEVAS